MNLYGSGRGSGIRPLVDPGKKPRAPRRASGPTKYTDEQVAHAKYLLTFNSGAEVARLTGMPLLYIRSINSGVLRAYVEPKEMK